MTATAAELTRDELRTGTAPLERLVVTHRPGIVAFLGLTSYRTAYGLPKAAVGRQAEAIGGVPVWLLPNPSGLTRRELHSGAP